MGEKMQCCSRDSERDESTKEQLQIPAPISSTESMHEITEMSKYAISEITNPQSYCGEKNVERMFSTTSNEKETELTGTATPAGAPAPRRAFIG